MSSYPTGFSADLQPLPVDLGERGNEARARLAARGFIVVAGHTEYTAGTVSAIARQPHIKDKMCPKDPTEKRFGSLGSTREWLKKGGGRAMFLLARVATGGVELNIDKPVQDQVVVEGYGWTGNEPCDKLPNNPTTFAVRVGENALGNRAAEPFTTLIITGSAALYGATGFGLETWEDNTKAVAAYEAAGWQLENRAENEERRLADGTVELATRRYYSYPDEYLPQSAV